MRIAVDIPDNLFAALREICAREGLSLDAAIGEAVASYLADRRKPADDAFGSWRRDGKASDGPTYQQTLRDEW
ncbi:MAG: hypothetical protein JF625_09430 [Inquilinus limosus]|uniref:Ribbon-helix-helix protein CopG domain-containing protein n=1 Tax=Inquilinus limosus TaxID=171674 RepID=A0A952FIL4_9PROT|nr:hypothetical protein [Inquilinus limosus]